MMATLVMTTTTQPWTLQLETQQQIQVPDNGAAESSMMVGLVAVTVQQQIAMMVMMMMIIVLLTE